MRVKICGITSAADARLAVLAGADAIGLNFYAGSPRCVSEDLARRIVQSLPPFVEPVGLVVNETPAQIVERACRSSFLHAIQWHGEAPPVPPIEVSRFIPAFQVRTAGDLSRARAYLDRCREAGRLPAALLVDGYIPGHYGGTGHPPPWDLLADFQPGVPLILAGGLDADNVALAIRIVRPDAVDVASGVEAAPGIKDADKVKRFIAGAREAFLRL